MTQDKIAKNLLEDKNCDTCQNLNNCTFDSKEYCGTSPLSESLRRISAKKCDHPPLPKYRTCKDWKPSEPYELLKKLTPILRRVYPNKIAADIVSVQPMDSTEIFRLKDDE